MNSIASNSQQQVELTALARLTDEIANEMQRLYPNIKSNLAKRYSNKYCLAVVKELTLALTRPENKNKEQLSFSAMQMRKSGIIKYQGTTNYIFDFMKANPKTRLLDIKFGGAKGIYMRVTINPIYEGLIMQAISDTTEIKSESKIIKHVDSNYNRTIPIDMTSLMSFLEETRRKLKNIPYATKPGLAKKLAKDIATTQLLLTQIKTVHGNNVVQELWIEKDTGRVYGCGNSLQTINKEIRHAALGVCHKYDFKACAFSVMLSLAQTIDPSIRVESIAGYVRNRKQVREVIATSTGANIEQVKNAFTILGFGGKPIDNWHNSIFQAMGSRDAYLKLIQQQDFKWITEDLEIVSNIIYNTFPAEFDLYLGKHYSDYPAPQDDKKPRKRTRGQKLAWIYQNIEAYLMHKFVNIVREASGQEPLMTVHDCVYYANALSSATRADLNYLLRLEFPYVAFEHEEIYPISTQEHYDNRFNSAMQEEQDHYQRIQAEEQRARGYKSEFVQRDQIRVKSFDTPEASYDYDNDPWYQALTTQEQQEYRNIRNELTSAK